MSGFAEFAARLSPACGDCGGPVQRVEMTWHLDEDGRWRCVASAVCADGHRAVVQPF